MFIAGIISRPQGEVPHDSSMDPRGPIVLLWKVGPR